MSATKGGALAAAFALTAGAGCLSTSSYNTARMLPQGATRVSAAVSQYEGHATVDTDSESHGVGGLEAMVSHGVSDDFEIGGKVAVIDEDPNFYHFMVVPKLSLVRDQFAFVAPTGVGYLSSQQNSDGTTDDGGHFFETLPGVVASHVINPSVELTGALQLVWLINDQFDDSSFFGGANVGVRLRPPGVPWCVQPEIGVTVPISDRDNNVDYILQYGLAFHYDFGGTAASTDAGMAAPVTAPPSP